MGTDTVIKTKPLVEVKEPPLFKVIYVNDEVTTMEFVIESLVVVFHIDRDTALSITNLIHEQGSAVVAVLPFEIAEQKGIEVTANARAQSFPLQIKLEPEVSA